MFLNTLVFVIFSFLVLLSTIGYGQVFSNNIFNGSRNIILPLKGLFGILTLYILSTITHTFFPHDYIHNLIILTLGIIFFFKNINNTIDRNHLKYIVFFFIILYLGFLISKTNEDFPYYHLPNSLQFSEHKLQFGLGNLNHGFKHFSSLFLINSLFYFPIVEFYLFNISNFLFQIFFFSILLILLFENKINNFNKIFISLIFLIYLGKFYRLAEYGADYAGQFLVMLTCVYSFLLLNNKTINQVKREEIFYISSLLVVFSITIKFMFIIYVLVPFVVFLISFKLNEIIKFIFNLKFLFISLFLLLSVFFFNFSSTGCLVYPVSLTCFYETAEWTIDKNTIEYLSLHYEAWSKAGKGTGYQLDNLKEYVSGLNWFDFWVKNYFFTKVTDYILVIIFIVVVFFGTYFKNIKKRIPLDIKVKTFFITYVSVFVVFLLWFLNFPTLRYAGYSILSILIIFPFCILFSKFINLEENKNFNKLKYLIILVLLIFNFKNVDRLINELKLSKNEHHNFSNFPYFWVDEVEYETIFINNEKFFKVVNRKPCWNTPPTCLKNTSKLEVYKKNGYIFYKNK